MIAEVSHSLCGLAVEAFRYELVKRGMAPWFPQTTPTKYLDCVLYVSVDLGELATNLAAKDPHLLAKVDPELQSPNWVIVPLAPESKDEYREKGIEHWGWSTT